MRRSTYVGAQNHSTERNWCREFFFPPRMQRTITALYSGRAYTASKVRLKGQRIPHKTGAPDEIDYRQRSKCRCTIYHVQYIATQYPRRKSALERIIFLYCIQDIFWALRAPEARQRFVEMNLLFHIFLTGRSCRTSKAVAMRKRSMSLLKTVRSEV